MASHLFLFMISSDLSYCVRFAVSHPIDRISFNGLIASDLSQFSQSVPPVLADFRPESLLRIRGHFHISFHEFPAGNRLRVQMPLKSIYIIRPENIPHLLGLHAFHADS